MLRLLPIGLALVALAGCGSDDESGPDGGSDDGVIARGSEDRAPTLEEVEQVVDDHPLSSGCKKLESMVTRPGDSDTHQVEQVLCDDSGVALRMTFSSPAEQERDLEEGAYAPANPFVVGGAVRVWFEPALLPGGYEQIEERREGFSDVAEQLVELCDCGEAREGIPPEGYAPVG